MNNLPEHRTNDDELDLLVDERGEAERIAIQEEDFAEGEQYRREAEEEAAAERAVASAALTPDAVQIGDRIRARAWGVGIEYWGRVNFVAADRSYVVIGTDDGQDRSFNIHEILTVEREGVDR